MSLAKRIHLAEKRGRLLAEIKVQRRSLAEQVEPLVAVLAVADRGLAVVDAAKQRVQQQPAIVAAAVAVLFVLRPRRVWRWSRRAWFLWQAVGKLRQRFNPVNS